MSNIDPQREQFDAFKALPRDQTILMLNLIRLRDQAQYSDDRQLSGAQAYAEYGRHSGPIFSRVGGQIIWRGEPQAVLIGPSDEHWDVAFIAQYPSANAFLEMVSDPDYQAIVYHRQAAVLDSRLIRFGQSKQAENLFS